jgi:hypothetical protein
MREWIGAIVETRIPCTIDWSAGNFIGGHTSRTASIEYIKTRIIQLTYKVRRHAVAVMGEKLFNKAMPGATNTL